MVHPKLISYILIWILDSKYKASWNIRLYFSLDDEIFQFLCWHFLLFFQFLTFLLLWNLRPSSEITLVFQKAKRCCWGFGNYWKKTPLGRSSWQYLTENGWFVEMATVKLFFEIFKLLYNGSQKNIRTIEVSAAGTTNVTYKVNFLKVYLIILQKKFCISSV